MMSENLIRKMLAQVENAMREKKSKFRLWGYYFRSQGSTAKTHNPTIIKVLCRVLNYKGGGAA